MVNRRYGLVSRQSSMLCFEPDERGAAGERSVSPAKMWWSATTHLAISVNLQTPHAKQSAKAIAKTQLGVIAKLSAWL